MKNNISMTILDKVLLFYEAFYFILYAVGQAVSSLHIGVEASIFRVLMAVSICFSIISIVRSIRLKNTLWRDHKLLLAMLVILNIMIMTFSFFG